MVTYSTSDECAHRAGMKTQTSQTKPNTTMIDESREDAYSKIAEVIGLGTTDVNNCAKRIEKAMVARWIRGVQAGIDVPIELLEDEVNALNREFELLGMGTFEPDKDSSISGD